MTAPKLFISYSWSTPGHENRVLGLATELRDSGVDVILDKWDLREGQDAYAFMESMVSDPSVKKVLLVCDRVYVEKANMRSGGVGAEAQIISPKMYAAQSQTKFVALALERDDEGEPLVPNYYKSRIHIDYSEPGKESDSFDRLLRWAFDKPLHVKPTLGSRPAFLDEKPDTPLMRTTTQLRRATTAVKEDRQNWNATVTEHLNTYARELENFRLPTAANPVDEAVVDSLASFARYRNELVQILDDIALHRSGLELATLLQRFLEKLLPYAHPDGADSRRESSLDNFRFIKHEIFLYAIAILLRHDRFTEAAHLVSSEYYCPYLSAYGKEDMRPYTVFFDPPRSFEEQNRRLNLQRPSLQADLIKERCVDLPVAFAQLMQADFTLFLRSQSTLTPSLPWWPVTLAHAGRFASRFELFARARSRRYFDRLAPVLGVQSVDQLRELIAEFSSGKRQVPRWQFETIDPAMLTGIGELATRE